MNVETRGIEIVLTAIAWGLLKTEDNIATPCSVKA